MVQQHHDAYLEQPSHVLGERLEDSVTAPPDMKSGRSMRACLCREVLADHEAQSQVNSSRRSCRKERRRETAEFAAWGRPRARGGETLSSARDAHVAACGTRSTWRLTAVRKRRHCESGDEDKTERETFSEQLSARANGEPKIHQKPTQQNKSTKTSHDDEARKLRTQEQGLQQAEKSTANSKQRGASPTAGKANSKQRRAEQTVSRKRAKHVRGPREARR